MASNHTTNFNLSQWEENDQVLRADFNADNAKIDAALSAAEQQLQTVQTQAVAAVQAAEQRLQTAQTQASAEAEQKLSAAAESLRRVVGVYVGTDTEQQIELGFQPAAVFAVYEGNMFNTNALGTVCHAALAIAGEARTGVTINATGFKVRDRLSTNSIAYHYIAWK